MVGQASEMAQRQPQLPPAPRPDTARNYLRNLRTGNARQQQERSTTDAGRENHATLATPPVASVQPVLLQNEAAAFPAETENLDTALALRISTDSAFADIQQGLLNMVLADRKAESARAQILTAMVKVSEGLKL